MATSRPLPRSLAAALAFLAFALLHAVAHEGRTHVVLDTDAALDDLRAIALLAGEPNLEIEALVLTDPRQGMDQAALDVAEILEAAGRVGVPIARGAEGLGPDPRWPGRPAPAAGRTRAQELSPAEGVLETVLRDAHHPLTWVALGPLTTLDRWLDDDDFRRSSLAAVHWSGGHPKDARPGWNVERDRRAAQGILDRGVAVRAVALLEKEQIVFGTSLHDALAASDGVLARALVAAHAGEANASLVARGHLAMWDDAVALDLLEPGLASPGRRVGHARVIESWDRDAARDAFLTRLLEAGMTAPLEPRTSVLLRSFPSGAAEAWRVDVAPLVDEILSRHGVEEWTAAWLTSELHRHLGIYSIVGAKMGIRAREILDASLDELEVVSRAGLTPPLSCLNDGLQVSTGASLGRGTIRVTEKGPHLVAARFTKGQRSVTLSLEPAVLERIGRDVGAALRTHGGANGPGYFAEIRALSLRYWLELDRREIFEEQRLP